jgi:hypothetical protein
MVGVELKEEGRFIAKVILTSDQVERTRWGLPFVEDFQGVET